MMGIHTAKRKSLMGTMDRLAEGLGIKETIVGMVMMNANTMGSSDTLKGLLGSNGGFSIVSRHEVDIGKIRVVINKDGGSSVTLDSGATAVSRDKSRSRANKLVNTNNIPGSSCFADGLAIANAFGTPRFLVSFAVGTTRTSWGVDGCKIARDKSSTGHEPETGKTEVSEAFMNNRQTLLLALNGGNRGVNRSRIMGRHGRKGRIIGNKMDRRCRLPWSGRRCWSIRRRQRRLPQIIRRWCRSSGVRRDDMCRASKRTPSAA